MLFGILLLPSFAFAQVTSLQSFLIKIVQFINGIIIPLLFSIALIVFIWNVVQYFIIQGDSKDGRDKAKRHATYSIIAFVFLVSIWGIVNTLVSGLGFWTTTNVCPDYIKNCGDTSDFVHMSDTSSLDDQVYETGKLRPPSERGSGDGFVNGIAQDTPISDSEQSCTNFGVFYWCGGFNYKIGDELNKTEDLEPFDKPEDVY